MYTYKTSTWIALVIQSFSITFIFLYISHFSFVASIFFSFFFSLSYLPKIYRSIYPSHDQDFVNVYLDSF